MASKTKGGKTSSHGHDHAQGHSSDVDKIEEPLDEQELESLYAWVDSIPLSRPKRNISRDFSDGVLVAEIMHHYFPKMVEKHNFSSANATGGKHLNWDVLNRKVFSKMNFELAEDVINDLCICKPGMIEKVLLMLQVKIKRAEYARARNSDKPEADQHQMTPGRNNKMTRVGLEDTKGHRFMKTKHGYFTYSMIDDYGHIITQRYLDNRGWNSGVEHIPPRQRLKMPHLETDVVPRIMLEEREQELLARDEMGKGLQAKIQQMEHSLQLKDSRIDELTDYTNHLSYADFNHYNNKTKLHTDKQHLTAGVYGDHIPYHSERPHLAGGTHDDYIHFDNKLSTKKPQVFNMRIKQSVQAPNSHPKRSTNFLRIPGQGAAQAHSGQHAAHSQHSTKAQISHSKDSTERNAQKPAAQAHGVHLAATAHGRQHDAHYQHRNTAQVGHSQHSTKAKIGHSQHGTKASNAHKPAAQAHGVHQAATAHGVVYRH